MFKCLENITFYNFEMMKWDNKNYFNKQKFFVAISSLVSWHRSHESPNICDTKVPIFVTQKSRKRQFSWHRSHENEPNFVKHAFIRSFDLICFAKTCLQTVKWVDFRIKILKYALLIQRNIKEKLDALKNDALASRDNGME